MEYIFLRKDGCLILSSCLFSISHFNAIHIVNPQDTSKIVSTLIKIFSNFEFNT